MRRSLTSSASNADWQHFILWQRRMAEIGREDAWRMTLKGFKAWLKNQGTHYANFLADV